jgi:hypothetical protein
MRRALRVGAIGLTAVVVVAVLILLLFHQQNEQSRVGCAMAPDCATTTTNSPPTRQSGTFVARIELPSTVMVGGSELTGHLVVENNTGATVNLFSGGKTGCTPQWTVSLGNDKIPPIEAFAASCGAKPLVLRAGETRFAFTLQARYDHCGGIGINGPLKPACVGSPPAPPPLPADQYHAIFTGDLPGVPKPAPVRVRVTAHS